MPSLRGRRLLCALMAGAASLAAVEHARAQDHPLPPAGQYPSLKISGFGDVNFGRTTNDADAKNFTLGQLALHMISELSPRVTFFGEISFSPRTDAGTGSPAATGFNVEVERMIVRFDRSDRLKVSFGRYHTPINYWNTAFHHGQWLQTTITRPEMIRFGSQFLPVHFIGGLVEGSVPAGGLNLSYKAGIGNGRGNVISRAGDAGDANEAVAWLANVYFKPDQVYGLEFGASTYADEVQRVGRGFDEHIVSGYAVWHKETPEVIAEVAAVRHRDPETSLVTWNQAYYVQAAWRLPGRCDDWKPYFRFEHVGIDSADLVFTAVPHLDNMSTLGVRYDFSSFAAAKGEYRTWRRTAASPRDRGGFFQLSFTF